VYHPAKFGDKLIIAMGEMLAPYGPLDILDPFAGTGRIHELQALGHRTVGVEIVPQYAELHPDTILGNSLYLTSAVGNRRAQAIACSPCYGNRLSDHHSNKDLCKRCRGEGVEEGRSGKPCRVCLGAGISMRHSYTHDLRRMTGDQTLQLDDDNAGKMVWGPKYRAFHEKVWIQVPGLLLPPALFLLNCKDFIKDKERQEVTRWHVETLEKLGFKVLKWELCDTGGLRQGANRERFPEDLVLLQLP
jgi:hypothetical protein